MPRDGNGTLVVFEPTLREIEQLLTAFDKILWYGMPVKTKASSAFRIPSTQDVVLIPLPPAIGGDKYLQKIKVLIYLPFLVAKVLQIMAKYGFIHTRGPSVPAWVAIIFSKFFVKKKIWHKYAGNWNEQSPPFSYRQQRSLLKKSPHPVTINGRWGDTNPNIVSFENPCFSEAELAVSRGIVKTFSAEKVEILFVGRLEHEKGIHHVLEAANQLPTHFNWHIVGDGKERKYVERTVSECSNVNFWGALSRTQLNEIYSKCHFFLLPTIASEGFPKVIAEACGFGCIPIVSQVSSISQYIASDFGYLLPHCSSAEVVKALQHIITLDNTELIQKSERARVFARLFTYERYVNRIRDEIFQIH